MYGSNIMYGNVIGPFAKGDSTYNRLAANVDTVAPRSGTARIPYDRIKPHRLVVESRAPPKQEHVAAPEKPPSFNIVFNQLGDKAPEPKETGDGVFNGSENPPVIGGGDHPSEEKTVEYRTDYRSKKFKPTLESIREEYHYPMIFKHPFEPTLETVQEEMEPPEIRTKNIPPKEPAVADVWYAPWDLRVNTKNLPLRDTGPIATWYPPWDPRSLRVNTDNLPPRDPGPLNDIEREVLTNGFIEGVSPVTWDRDWKAPWDGKTYGTYAAAKKGFEDWVKNNPKKVDEITRNKQKKKEDEDARKAREPLYYADLLKNPPTVLPQELKKNKYPSDNPFEFEKTSKRGKGFPGPPRFVREVKGDSQSLLKTLRELRAKRSSKPVSVGFKAKVLHDKTMRPTPPKISTQNLDIHKKGPHKGKRIKSDSNYLYKTPQQKITDADKPMTIPSERSERIAKRPATRSVYKAEKKRK